MRWYQRLSTKMALAVVAAVGIPLLAIGLFITQYSAARLKADAENLRQQKTETLVKDLAAIDTLMTEQVKSSMRVLKSEGLAVGAPALGAPVQIADKNVQNLMLGTAAQANNFAVVDKVKDLMGGTATLFVKSGDEFVRVTTNVMKPDGTRAVGTVLDPNGKAIAEIKQGKPFYGVVYILDQPYITGYDPIKDAKGETIGVWYVGYKMSSLEALGKSIQDAKILSSGFFALVDDKGKILFKSANAADDAVSAAAKSTDAVVGDWNVARADFAPWGYKVVSAYSQNDAQIVEQTTTSWTRVIGGDLLFISLLALIVFWITRRFTKPLNEAVKTANDIAEGKIDADEIKVKSNDEVGQMLGAMKNMNGYLHEMSGVANRIAAGDLNVQVVPRSEEDRFGTAFQNMVERTLKLVQTQDERDHLQRSIMKLLNEVADVADGDLTAEAEVTADATGAIADAFNFMIVELRGIIGRVKQTGMQVDTSATEIQFAAENLMKRSESQSSQMTELSTTLEQMAEAMQQVAADMNMSVRVSDNALTNAKQGTSVVQNNVAAMQRIRSRVQETAERIKKLGERSQEISGIVKIINDLAQRTSVLALNASIQATAAGQQGRGFVAVAEEVERLAVRSSQASKQIDVLTKAIQGETNEAVVSMETTVKEVAVGVKLTGEVGATLGEIETTAQQLAEISHGIALAARIQAQNSTDVSTSMKSVAAVSQTTAAGMKQSAQNVSQLAIWAQELRGSVASFRLPEAEEEIVAERAKEHTTGMLNPEILERMNRERSTGELVLGERSSKNGERIVGV